ncbi:unnamed protein product [Thelazia callipaeda]|uniref:LRRNT domain-containing protein n=1 Tax=Thelazia callipaeda TaxID=103827 RepID=A0A0N5CLF6_THECL|nr:unnamed protein product [Thelazia callipaeda]
MNQLRSNRCPSVHLIIIIIIIVISSCIVAGFSPKLRVVAAEKNKHIAKSQNWPNVNDQESEARRSRRHGFDYLQIKNSSCPNYCECEYIINNNSPDNIPEFSVFCHEGGLEQITFSKLLKQIPREVSILDVTAPEDKPNHLLWDDNLNQLRQLRILRLVNCAIPAISRALKLRTLEVLDLRNNNIQHLSVSIFSGIPSIRELNLAENLLSILPTGAFTYLKNLHTLSLAHNNISKVPVNLLRDLNNLRSLHLDGNQISVQEFNKLFADIPNLKQLELNDCGLSIDLIDDLALDKFTSLHQLGLAGNMLGKVPERVLRNRLTSLMTLDLSRNGLVEIRPEVFAKSNISRLILAGNRLGANRNALSENSLKTNTKLLELDLSRNNFAHFHSGYLGIVRETVEVLHLNGNHIASIEQQLIANMTKLNILHLGYNFIEYLPEKLPDEFAQLTFLNLSGNQLSSLPEHSRTALPLLQKIDISDNRFVSFSITIIQQFFNSLEKVSQL